MVTVDTMYQCDIRGYIPDLVCLKVSNEMPFNIMRKEGVFRGKFLGFVFSEYPLSCMIGLYDG